MFVQSVSILKRNSVQINGFSLHSGNSTNTPGVKVMMLRVVAACPGQYHTGAPGAFPCGDLLTSSDETDCMSASWSQWVKLKKNKTKHKGINHRLEIQQIWMSNAARFFHKPELDFRSRLVEVFSPLRREVKVIFKALTGENGILQST